MTTKRKGNFLERVNEYLARMDGKPDVSLALGVIQEELERDVHDADMSADMQLAALKIHKTVRTVHLLLQDYGNFHDKGGCFDEVATLEFLNDCFEDLRRL